MGRIAAALVISFSAAACSTFGGDGDAPPEPAQIQFMDSATFDSELSSALEKGGPEVEVTFVGPVTVNEMPERLDVWLYQVKDNYGGALELVPEDEEFAERGAAVMGLALAVAAYGELRERLLYRPARKYDAFVYYRPGDGRITRVVFRLRSEETAEG